MTKIRLCSYTCETLYKKIVFYGYTTLSTLRHIITARKSQQIAYDVLIYLAYNNGDGKYHNLIFELMRRGVRAICISEDPYSSAKRFRTKLSFSKLDLKIRVPVFNYLLFSYGPSVVILEDDMFPRSHYLYLKSKGVTVVNQAHAVSGSTELFRSKHFDYYFIFGKRSRENLEKNPHAEGGATIIEAGSPFFQRKSIATAQHRNMKTIGLVGTYFHSTFDPLDFGKIQKYYKDLLRLVSDFKQENFLYKPHLIRDRNLERDLLAMPNVEEVNFYMHILAAKCSLMIMPPSFASLEAAAVGTPFLIYDWNSESKMSRDTKLMLGDTVFFDRVSNFEELLEYFNNRDEHAHGAILKLEEYYKMHVSRDDSVDYIADVIANIAEGKNISCVA